MHSVLTAATFDGTEVKAFNWGHRVMVGPYPDHGRGEDFEGSFWEALRRLEDSTGWKHTYGSLAGDLMGDYEPAHAFVAVNLSRLAKYCAGEWVSFSNPQRALWELQQLLHAHNRVGAQR